MWGALGTQPGKRLAGRADGVNPCYAILPDPSPGVGPGLGCYLLRACQCFGSQSQPGRSLGGRSCASGDTQHSWGLPPSLRFSAHPPPVSVSLSFLCLHLSMPLEGDRSPLRPTIQSVTLCCQPGWKPPFSAWPPAPSPPWPPGSAPLSPKAAPPSFLSTHLSSAQSPAPISLRLRPPHPPASPPSPFHLSSLQLSSLCPPICHQQLGAHSPPSRRPAFPLRLSPTAWASLRPGLPSLVSSFISVVPSLPPGSLTPPQPGRERDRDSRVLALSPPEPEAGNTCSHLHHLPRPPEAPPAPQLQASLAWGRGLQLPFSMTGEPLHL